MLGERNLLCGLHVHVELPDPDVRVELMRRVTPFVPLFIALATSSPFWRSRRTGLMGYRLAAYDELPRTGLPPLFETKARFRRLHGGAGRGARDPDASYRVVGDPSVVQAHHARAARARLAARASRTRLPSPRSIARWCAIWCAIPTSTPISTSSTRRIAQREQMACAALRHSRQLRRPPRAGRAVHRRGSRRHLDRMAA